MKWLGTPCIFWGGNGLEGNWLGNSIAEILFRNFVSHPRKKDSMVLPGRFVLLKKHHVFYIKLHLL